MRPLLTLSARCFVLCGAIVLALGAAAGAVRLLPWLVAPGVPLRLAWPFARSLLQVAAEVSVLVAPCVGLGVAAAVFVERGEARALAALGVSPARLVSGVAGAGSALILAYAALVTTYPSVPVARLSTELVEDGRNGCLEGDAGRPRRVDVPLAALSWLCFREGPRLVGRLPGLTREAWFSASSVSADVDRGALVAHAVALTARLEQRPLHLRAREVRVQGLARWESGGRRDLSGGLRAAWVGASSVLAGLAAALLVLRRGAPGPVATGVHSAVAAAAMAALLARLDLRQAPLALYAALPVVGIALVTGSLHASTRMSARFVAGRNSQ